MSMSFKMALRSIGSNKLRSVLTMLGIIIGVIALVVLVSLVNGATKSVNEQIASLGTNYMQVYIWNTWDDPLTSRELETWADGEELVETVAPTIQNSATAKSGARSKQVSVVGTTSAFYDIRGLKLEKGRFLKPVDVQNNSCICVLDSIAADNVVGYRDCVGQEISLNGIRYTVAGVRAENDSMMMFSGESTVYIPFSSMLRQYAELSGGIDSFYAIPPKGVSVSDAAASVRNWLSGRFEKDEWGNDNFYVSTMDALEDSASSVTSVLSALLGGIASISLIVGGIGIMNIMLVTVTERTREIGIRKAIGATRRSILRQFLMEAVVLCMMGCIIGVFLSWCILNLANSVVQGLGLTFDLDAGVVLLAAAFCFAIGLIFGLYPANKAAKMKPIDALHYGG